MSKREAVAFATGEDFRDVKRGKDGVGLRRMQTKGNLLAAKTKAAEQIAAKEDNFDSRMSMLKNFFFVLIPWPAQD